MTDIKKRLERSWQDCLKERSLTELPVLATIDQKQAEPGIETGHKFIKAMIWSVPCL